MTTTARRMFELLEPICLVTFFADECNEELAALGHRTYWDGYFASRAASLGRVPAEVVHAAFYNFAVLPKGEELDDFWARKQRGEAWPKPAKYTDIHMPRNTGAGVVIGAFSLVFGFAMIWHIWWMAIAGFVGMIATWIIHSFNDDVDYYVQVDEIERIERQHFENINKVA